MDCYRGFYGLRLDGEFMLAKLSAYSDDPDIPPYSTLRYLENCNRDRIQNVGDLQYTPNQEEIQCTIIITVVKREIVISIERAKTEEKLFLYKGKFID